MASSSSSNPFYCATCHLSFSDKAALHKHWKSHGQIDLSHNGDVSDSQGNQEKIIGSLGGESSESVRVTPPFMAFSPFSQSLLLQQQLLNAAKLRNGDEMTNAAGNYDLPANGGRLLLPTGSAEIRGGPRPTAFHSVQQHSDVKSDCQLPQPSISNNLSGVSAELMPFFHETLAARAALFQQISSQQILLQAAAAADPTVLNQLATLEAAGLFPGLTNATLAGFNQPLFPGAQANVGFGMNGFLSAANQHPPASKMYLGQFARHNYGAQDRLETDPTRPALNYNQLPFASPIQSELRHLSSLLSPSTNVQSRSDINHVDRNPLNHAHSDPQKQFGSQSSSRANGYLDPRRNSAPDIGVINVGLINSASKIHTSNGELSGAPEGSSVIRSGNPSTTISISPRQSGSLTVAVSSTTSISNSVPAKLTTAGLSSPKAVEQYINNLLSVNEALLQPSPVLLKKRQNTRAMGSSFGGTGNLSPQGNRPVRSHSLIADLAGASLLSNVTASSSRFDSDETKVITSPIKQEGSPQTSQTNSASAISEKEPSICEICGQKFTKSGMLRLHMDTHSNRQKLEFQCSICSAVFRSKISYQNHLSSHSYDSTSQPNSDIEESAANGLIIKSEVPETNFSCQEEDSHGHSSVIRLNSEPISSDGAALKLELKMVRSAAEGISTKEQQGASPLLDTPALVMAVNESLGKSGVREMELNVTTDVIVAETEENQFEAVALAQEKGQRNDTPLVPPKKRQRTLESCLNSPEISTGNGDTMPIGPVSLAKIGESSVYSSGAQAVLTGTSITTEESGEVKTSASALPPALKFLTGSQPNFKVNPVTDKDESNKCEICGKQFNKPGMLKLHMDIHSYQQSGRKYEYRCTFCSAVFRSRAALQSHVVCHSKETSKTGEIGEVPVETVAVGCVRRQEASVDKNGPSAQRPNGLKARPFACVDCGCAFRIHGHLAKHLRSKLHITKWECLGKLPIGTYAKLEETGAFWSEIDTKDCESSLATLQALARKVMKDKDVESCKDMNDVTKLMAKGKTLTESPFKWHGKMEKLSQQENKGGKTVEKLSEESEENGMSLACTEILSASPDFVLETPNLVMAIGENSDESGDPREMNVHRRNPLLKSATINGDDLYRTSTPVRQSETITSGSPSSSESPKPFESPVLNGVVPKSSGAVKADVWIPPMAPTDSQSKSTISTSPPKSAKQSTTAANKVALDLGDRNNNSHENRRSDSISLPSSARLTTEESLATPTSAELKPQVEGGTEVSKALMPDTFSDADVESDRVKPSKCHFCSDVEFHRPEELEIHLYADHIVMRDGSGFQCPRCDSDKATYPTRENLRVHIAGHFYGKKSSESAPEPVSADQSDTNGRHSGSFTTAVATSRPVTSSPSIISRKRYKTHLVKLNSIAEVPNVPCVGGSKQYLPTSQWHHIRTPGTTSFNVSTSPDSTADSEDASLQSAVSQHSGESQESSPVNSNSSNPSSMQEVPMISPVLSAQSKRQAFSALKRKSMDEGIYPFTLNERQRQTVTPDSEVAGIHRRCASAVDKVLINEGDSGLRSSAPNVALGGTDVDSKGSETFQNGTQPSMTSLPVSYYAAYSGPPSFLQSQSGLLLNFPSSFTAANGGFPSLPAGYEQLLQLQLLQSAGQSGLFLNPNLSAFLGSQQMLMPQSQLLQQQQESTVRHSTPTMSPLLRRDGTSEGSGESLSRSSHVVVSPMSNSNDGNVRNGTSGENRNIFFCGLCRKSLPTQTELEEHMVSHALPRPFVCDQCDAGFTNLPALQNHLNSHGLQQGK